MPRAVEPVPGREVLLAAELRRAVRRERPPLGASSRRRPVALAVDRAARRREDDLRAVPARRLEDAHRADDVDVGVVVGPLDRDAHVRLGGEVEDDLRPHRVEDRVGRADVGHVERRAPAATFSRFPFERSSRTCTSSPRASSASTTCEPMKPAPPVTTARIGGSYPRRGGRPRSRSKASTAPARARRPRGSPRRRARRRPHASPRSASRSYDGNPFSRAVADYLNGEFGARRRGASRARGAALRRRPLPRAPARSSPRSTEHDLVICDRYVASNAAHQGAKLQRRRRAAGCSTGSSEVEYGEFALPRPDLVILLDAPVALARTARRAQGRTRLHDARGRHPRGRRRPHDATREVYLELAQRDGWRVVATAGEDGALRDVDEIAAEVWARGAAARDDVRRRRRAGRGEAPARRRRSRKALRTRISCTGRPASASAPLAFALRGRAARRPRARRARDASRPLRARAARRPDPHRRHPHAAPRPAHAAVRGVAPRLPRLRRRHDERGRGGRAAQGSRGAAVLRGDRAVANDLGPLPETIRSRCQLVPFRRLSERAVREAIARARAGARGRAR